MSLENQKKKKMDMSKASRGIWLVKVPNYVAQMWEQAPNDMQVATMRMEKSGDDKEPAKVKLILSQDLMQLAPDKLLASEHDLKLCKAIKGARLTGIFSTVDDTDSVMEGWVTHKMECLPICNAQYLKMKQQSIRGVRPMRSAEALNHIVKSYKPVSNHAHNKDDGKRRKDATKVLSKENIMDMLFQAFEKHQYYTLKDLQFITKQSVFVLKAILKDIGDYSKDPAHRQMWELKEEYRHYQKPESETK
ncbi:general transcription factor IIF subunit 2 isoform X1 [Drosophila virilis]|uniref:General transcription factor IIF subunit 2 n=1 Tax=Drosophila virilis TaxID=7244 RepID=B4LPK5_DROVI|nr:general transcription factor IIF subunit 2 isoform X1 [Drosophila virilis]EDW60243.1 uncharacterized protein Dvir_GJ21374, isoform A [Drosophila virilis]